jgi:hypothetical protein
MPNWCENRIKISGSTEKINKLWEDVNSNGLLNALRPQPDNLFLENLDSEKRLELDEDGVPNWYDWRIENWGTKWEVNTQDLCVEDNGDGTSDIYGDFDSAWSPPIEAYIAFNEADNGCEVEGWYSEFGCDYCGLYNSREGDVYCDSVSAELALPEAERSEAFKRIECDINLYEWYFAMREISDEE